MYINPYQNIGGRHGYKTNFHTHAGTGAGTCGANDIPPVVNAYREMGYNALCISNHDLYSDTSKYTDDKFLMIQGVEYSQNEHMLTVGVSRSYHELDHQKAIDETLSEGGFVILCHPNWQFKEYWPWKKIDTLKGYAGIEVINMLIYRLNGSGLATDTWDYLLTSGKLVYGFGNDDFHRWGDLGRSFNVIYAHSHDYAGIKKAVDNGEFFASTGIYLDYLTLENNTIKVKARYPEDTYNKNFTYRFIREGGRVVSVQCGETAEYTLRDEMYVRVEVIAENGMMMFSQPVYKSELFRKP